MGRRAHGDPEERTEGGIRIHIKPRAWAKLHEYPQALLHFQHSVDFFRHRKPARRHQSNEGIRSRNLNNYKGEWDTESHRNIPKGIVRVRKCIYNFGSSFV